MFLGLFAVFFFIAAMALLFSRPIADTVWPPIQEINSSELVQATAERVLD